ncbi:hypothetical protein JHK82_026664 [Glycine max]|nr:hypothetical protein JHK87_026546 [Glycine soja]KAG4995844.1 hypothetical protein JHK85_027283 [Glycine max]KAG5002645.1 hypothetical protein JHK86_026784 [Glycine max]KAG5125829.1 hypothetical protein JHK82_026664 [Glycine max]KAG5150425.1 hypothetical protein JHK84_026897 [Glycine max]
MGDLNTWINATLTNEDTCLDWFQGEKERKVKWLLNRVLKVYYIVHVWALVNKLATTCLGSIPDP